VVDLQRGPSRRRLLLVLTGKHPALLDANITFHGVLRGSVYHELAGPLCINRSDAGTLCGSQGPTNGGLTMEPTMHHSSVSAVWADALFVSALQRCDQPSAGQVRQAVAATVSVFGPRGCAERVAQEFGDHPETAVTRMRWARELTAEAISGRQRKVARDWAPAPRSVPRTTRAA